MKEEIGIWKKSYSWVLLANVLYVVVFSILMFIFS
jgi:hypothetical protein